MEQKISLRWLLLILAFVIAASAAGAQTCYVRNDSVTNALGQSIPNISVTYYLQGTPNTLATVYGSTTCSTTCASNGGATCTNPQITNGLGQTTAYLQAGLYTIVYSGAQIQTQTKPDQNIGGSGGGGGLPSGCTSSGTGQLNCTVLLSAGGPITGNYVTLGPQNPPPANWTFDLTTPYTAFDQSFVGQYSGSVFYPELQMNSDGCNPNTEFSALQGAVGGMAAVSGCVLVPSGSTTHQPNAVAGFIHNQQSGNNAVALYGQAYCTALNTQCWGANPVSSDAPGLTGGTQHLWGIEDDVNVNSASTQAKGLDLIGAWGAEPSSTEAIDIEKPLGGSGTGYYWPTGIQVESGATGAALYINPAIVNNLGSGSTSQAIIQNAWSAGGLVNSVQQNVDNQGDFVLTFQTSGTTENTITFPGIASNPISFPNPILASTYSLTGSGGFGTDGVTGKTRITPNTTGFEILNAEQTQQNLQIDDTGDVTAPYGTTTVNNLTVSGTCTGCGSGSTGISGQTGGQVAIAGTATTITSSKALAGSGAGIATGPTSSTSNDVATFTGTGGQIQDSGKALTGSGAGITTGPTSSTSSDLATFSGSSGQLQDSGKQLTGSGAGVTTGPTSSTSLDLTEFTGTAGQVADSGIVAATVLTAGTRQIACYSPGTMGTSASSPYALGGCGGVPSNFTSGLSSGNPGFLNTAATTIKGMYVLCTTKGTNSGDALFLYTRAALASAWTQSTMTVVYGSGQTNETMYSDTTHTQSIAAGTQLAVAAVSTSSSSALANCSATLTY